MIEREKTEESDSKVKSYKFLLAIFNDQKKPSKRKIKIAQIQWGVNIEYQRVTNFLIFFDWLFLHSCSNRSIYIFLQTYNYKLPNPKKQIGSSLYQRSTVHNSPQENTIINFRNGFDPSGAFWAGQGSTESVQKTNYNYILFRLPK